MATARRYLTRFDHTTLKDDTDHFVKKARVNWIFTQARLKAQNDEEVVHTII